MAAEKSDVQLGASLDGRGVDAGAQQIEQRVGQMAGKVATEADKAGKSVDGIGDKGKQAGEKLEQSTRSIIASIERTTAAAKAGERGTAAYFEELGKQRGISADVLRPYIEQLRQAEAAQRAAAGTLNTMGVSARQTAAALRGVPAQFTDIITSLQGGQAPLTVLLQQGGQLKDMFGGIGAAAQALGGYILGLINPYTVLAATLGVVAFGYEKGAQEGREFERTLILTGGAAGKSAGQLSDIAEAIGKLGGATTGRAAALLNEIAASGAVGGQNLQRFAQAALALERAGGPAASATAKAFADLAKAPLDAILKLNETQNFLTASTARQIKLLEDQGRSTEAARLAQETYAATLEQRTPQMERQLGLVERAWRGITDAAKRAADAVVSVGRPDSTNALLDAAERRLQDLQQQREVGRNAGRRAGTFDAQILAQQQLVAALRQGAAFEAQSAAAQAENNRLQKLALDYAKDREKDASSEAKIRKEVLEAETKGRQLIAAGLLTEKQLQEDIRAIKEKGAKSTSNGEEAAARARVEAARQYLVLLETQGQQAQKLTDGQKRALQIEEQLRGSLTASERAEKSRLLLLAQQQASYEASAAALERRNKAVADAEATTQRQVDAEIRSFEATRQKAAEQEAANAVYGKGKTAIEEMVLAQQEQILVQLDASDRADPAYIAALNLKIAAQRRYVDALKAADFKTLSQGLQEYGAQLQTQAQFYRDEAALAGLSTLERAKIVAQRKAELEYAKQVREIDRSSLSDDEKRTLRDEAARQRALAVNVETAKAVQDEWQRAAQQIEASITDALLRGFESGKGFAENLADTVRNLFKTMVLRPVVQLVVQNGTNAVLQVIGAAAGGSGQGALTNLGNAGSIYSAASGASGLYGSALAYGSNAAVYSGAAYGTGFASQQSAMLAAQEAGMASSAGSSAFAAYAGMAAAIAAGIYKANQDYSQGFGNSQAIQAQNQIFGGNFGQFSTEGALSNLLSSLGFSDRLSSLLSGSTAVAKIIGRAAPQITGRGVQGTFGGGDFAGTGFADIFEKGGLLRSDKRSTQTFELGDALGRFLDDAAKGVLDKATQYGKALGLPVDQLASITEQIKVTLTDDAAANQKAIADALGGYGDALLAGFSQAIGPLQQYGETTAQTIERVAGAILGVNDVLERLGLAAFDASVQGGQAAVQLQAAFGDLQTLQSASQDYYRNFFSDEERRTRGLAEIGEVIRGLGLSVPETREQFRALVDGLDLTTEAGSRSFAALLGLSGAFAELVPATEDAAAAAAKAAADMQAAADKSLKSLALDRAKLEADLLRAQGDLVGAAAAERDIALRALTEGVSPALAEVITAAFDYNQSLREQASALDAAATAADQAQRAWQTAADGIQSEIERIRGISANPAQSLAGAQSAFAIATAQARAGDLNAAKSLPALSETLLSLAGAQASSQLELQRLRAQTVASLLGTNDAIAARTGVSLQPVATQAPQGTTQTAATPEQREQTEAVQGLREDMAAQSRALVQLQSRVARLLERWDADGLPETRVTE